MIHIKILDDFELINLDNENRALLEFPQDSDAHVKHNLTARVSRGVGPSNFLATDELQIITRVA
jgi:hypothetical protein